MLDKIHITLAATLVALASVSAVDSALAGFTYGGDFDMPIGYILGDFCWFVTCL